MSFCYKVKLKRLMKKKIFELSGLTNMRIMVENIRFKTYKCENINMER